MRVNVSPKPKLTAQDAVCTHVPCPVSAEIGFWGGVPLMLHFLYAARRRMTRYDGQTSVRYGPNPRGVQLSRLKGWESVRIESNALAVRLKTERPLLGGGTFAQLLLVMS